MAARAFDPHGPLHVGDLVQLTDTKGRMHTITLEPGRQFHSHKGALEHDDLIGGPEGVVVVSTGGMPYLALRPMLSDFVLSMPRGATVVYPKDAARIVGLADLSPGAQVLEAGAGSGALTCSLLRAVGDAGRVWSYERRADFAEVATRNVTRWFGAAPPSWRLVVGDLQDRGRPPRRCPGRGRARHARALGVPRRGRHRAASRRRCSWPTSPPRPSCPGWPRRCASTAGGPSPARRSRWCAPGTWRDWPYGPTTG